MAAFEQRTRGGLALLVLPPLGPSLPRRFRDSLPPGRAHPALPWSCCGRGSWRTWLTPSTAAEQGLDLTNLLLKAIALRFESGERGGKEFGGNLLGAGH